MRKTTTEPSAHSSLLSVPATDWLCPEFAGWSDRPGRQSELSSSVAGGGDGLDGGDGVAVR